MGYTLVTGATGFVGRALIERLTADGVPVLGAVRAVDTTLPAKVKQVVVSDISNVRGWEEALAGVTTVVHLAGRAHILRRNASAAEVAEYRRVNVEGTRAVAHAALTTGVSRFVFLSSVAAVAQDSDVMLTSDTLPHPQSSYGHSKLEAEGAVRATCASGLSTTILRPPLVYGPGMRANMLRLYSLVRSGVPLPFASIRNRRSFLYSGNLVAAIRHVTQSPAAVGQTYFLSDGVDFSTRSLVEAIGVSLGRRPRLIPLSESVLRAGARLADPVGRLLHLPLPSDMILRLIDSLFVDASPIERDTGFQPPFSADQGLAETARWFMRRQE